MISVNNYNEPQVKLTNQDRQFIELINNRLTMYGQLPYTIPQKLIIEMIKEAARYFFRMGYWRSQHVCFYRLPKSEIIEFLCNKEQHSPDEVCCEDYPNCKKHTRHHVHPEEINSMYRNMRGYAVKLPPFVNVVREIYRVNQEDNTTQEMTDSPESLMYSMQYSPYGISLMGINSQLYIYEKTVRMVEQNAWRAVYGTTVPFRYNSANNILIINRTLEDSDFSLMLQCDCNVDVQVLYSDDLFIKYVYAKTKQELKRLIGSHSFQLPGDVQISADEICANADTEIQEVNETLKGGTGIGDLILQR